LADFFTKALGIGQFAFISSKLGLHGKYSPTWGGVLHYDKVYFIYLLFDLEDIIRFSLLVDVFELKCVIFPL